MAYQLVLVKESPLQYGSNTRRGAGLKLKNRVSAKYSPYTVKSSKYSSPEQDRDELEEHGKDYSALLTKQNGKWTVTRLPTSKNGQWTVTKPTSAKNMEEDNEVDNDDDIEYSEDDDVELMFYPVAQKNKRFSGFGQRRFQMDEEDEEDEEEVDDEEDEEAEEEEDDEDENDEVEIEEDEEEEDEKKKMTTKKNDDMMKMNDDEGVDFDQVFVKDGDEDEEIDEEND
ncbi:hypothetical protein BDR26DRAFT_856196 [Obelidium mucronatum]|nr:hypothetical protein BDR26DRAFT_856196 [Obelidium mucronatum]